MPHSTQIRTRWVGAGVLDEKRRLRNDIPNLHETLKDVVRTQRGVAELQPSPAKAICRRRGFPLDAQIRQRVGTGLEVPR
jgi:hypothetical protein